MRELPPAILQHLVNVESDGWADGNVPTYNDGTFVPGAGGSGALVTLDAGTVSYDDAGDDVVVTVVAKWGVDGDGPYFDGTNVVAGDEAALRVDVDASELVVVPLNLPG